MFLPFLCQPYRREFNDMDITEKIIEGAQDVFSTMLLCDIKGKIITGDESETVQSNLTSMIGLGGDIRGQLAIHCPASVAQNITSEFLGMEVKELNDDVKDAIGELANMVAGALKISFEETGTQIQLAIPTSVIGDSFRVKGMKGALRYAARFEFQSEQFDVEMIYGTG